MIGKLDIKTFKACTRKLLTERHARAQLSLIKWKGFFFSCSFFCNLAICDVAVQRFLSFTVVERVYLEFLHTFHIKTFLVFPNAHRAFC